MLVTAVIFSAFHFDPVGFVARVEFGVLFGALRLYTGSLWPASWPTRPTTWCPPCLFLTMRQLAAESPDERPALWPVLACRPRA